MTASSSESEQRTPQESARARISVLGPQFQDWIEKSNHTEILAHFDELTSLAYQSEDNILIAKVLNTYGSYYWRVGQADQGFSCMKRALESAQQSGDHFQIGSVLNNIGNVFRVRGYFDEALEYFEKASGEFREINEKRGLAYTHGNIAAVYIETDRHIEAEPYLLETIRLFHEAGDTRGEANYLGDYAKVHIELNRIEEAIATAERAVSLVENDSDPHTYGTVLNSLGLVYARAKMNIEAKSVLEHALELHRSSHNLRFIGVTLTNLGYLVRLIGDSDLAIQYYREAATMQQQISDVRGEIISQGNIASVHFSERRWEECLSLLSNIMDSLQAFHDPVLLFDVLVMQTEVWRRMGDTVQAYATLETAERLTSERGTNPIGIPFCLRALLDLDQGNLASAAEWLAKANQVVSPQTPEANALYWVVQTMYWYAAAIDSSRAKLRSTDTDPSQSKGEDTDSPAITSLKTAYREELIATEIQANRIGDILLLLHRELQTKLSSLGIDQ